MRVIAVDWSGAQIGAARHIWLAEASALGCLDRLESGRTREQLASHLLTELALKPRTVVGLDFAFSFPSWYMVRLGLSTARELWEHVAEHGERWLAECAPPFWGRGARPRPAFDNPMFRRTELAVPRQHGIAPKSIFQIGGAGAVGTGSIRGMALLHALHEAGAHIWPFDPPGWPVVLEIYPRLMTGPVVKSRADARQRFVHQFSGLEPRHQRLTVASEDAFDAAISALVMLEHADQLSCLPAASDDLDRLEGRIWHPLTSRG